MRYYSLGDGQRRRLIAKTDGRSYDLTSSNPSVRTFGDLARTAAIAGTPVDELTDRFVTDGTEVDEVTLAIERRAPVVPSEVWTATGRQYDSQHVQADGSSPRRFRYKASARHTVGPNENVGVRSDLQWSFPQPELGVVLYGDRSVGYVLALNVTGGFDADEPYHPQGNVFDRSCAVGPCIVTRDSIAELGTVSMTITRNGAAQYERSRSVEDLLDETDQVADELGRYDVPADVTLLLTGALLPPDRSLSLQAEDVVSVDVAGIGTLETSVDEL